MDWYYPVLGGVVLGDAGRARLDERRDTFVMEGRGVRCVSDRPWVTVAETCECALAHLAVGDRQTRPRRCSAGPSSSATTTAATGPAPSSPTRSASPAASARTYTAAAVVLAADALAGAPPAASALFVEPRPASCRPLIDLADDRADASRVRGDAGLQSSRPTVRSGGGLGGCRRRAPPAKRPDSSAGR